MKKIIYALIFVILFIFFLFNILSMFGYPFFCYRMYKIGSGSMEPYLKVNDIIIIKPYNEYKVDDIVTYKADSGYVTHRIVSIDEDVVITKGDANNAQDNPISQDKIVGKMVYKFHSIHFISFLFSNPFSWVVLFIVGIIITCLIPDKKK